MVEMEEKGSTKMTALPLTPLHQVRVIKGTLEEVLREPCGDYVTDILTDKVDLDVIDMQERIRLHFRIFLKSAEKISAKQITAEIFRKKNYWIRTNCAVLS